MGFDYRRDASGIVIVTMDMDGQSANTMSPVYHDLMGETVSRLEAEEGLRGVVFASAKKTFFAGGDLNSLLTAERGDDAYMAWLNEDKGFLRRLEKLPVPVAAAINGAALGGGFEICLSCNHRVVLDSPAAIVGLPEVTLGLLPGAGGVARLPRVTSLDQALDLLLTGRFVAPQEALELGLVDRLVSDQAELVPAAIEWIMGAEATATQPWDSGRARALDAGAARALVAKTRAEVSDRTRGKLPAPLAILDIIEAGLSEEIDATLAHETEEFAALLGRAETRAAIWLNFFASNAIRSGKMRPAGEKVVSGKVAVIGDTDASRGVAKAAARKADVLQGGGDLAGCELALCFDNVELPETSECIAFGIEVSDVLGDVADPERTFGFRIPTAQPKSKVVEIILKPVTENAVARRAYDFFQSIGRVPVIVADTPGQFVARLNSAFVEEAVRLVADGLAPAEVAQIAYDAGMTASLPDISQSSAAAPDLAPLRADAEDRLLYAQSIAAIRALDEGVIRTVEEADVASVQGAGFPPHTGGAIRFVHGIGLDAFVARTAELTHRYGDRFALSPDTLAKLRKSQSKAA